ncbi:hypothetical protein BGX27_008130 [Mortierella sp. AM989]|nr:hypothetical protein BGX27_008130 [Mortierella sp. AM989]
MKFIKSILLISAAITTIASAAPLARRAPVVDLVSSNIIQRRGDTANVNIIVKTTSTHVSNVLQNALDNLLNDMKTAKVTSRAEELSEKKALLNVAVKAKIDQAKKDCSSEALEPLVKAAIRAETGSDDPRWANKEEAKKALANVNLEVTKLVIDHLKVTVNAELLSKDCAEKMTNTEIAPAEEPFSAESVGSEPETTEEPEPEAPAPISEETAPETPAPVLEAVPSGCTKDSSGINICVNINANIGKLVCKSGCKDANDAKAVLDLYVNLEKEFKPRLEHFYDKDIPTACEEERRSVVDSVLNLLNINADVNAIVNV